MIPAISFHRKYRLVPLEEFRFFSIIFYCVVLSVVGEIGAILWDITFFYQIQFLALISIYYVMYGYALRVHFQKSPKIVKYVMQIYFGILTLLIILWTKMDQPKNAKLLFWEVSATSTTYFPKGAGLKINDVFILSTSYYLLIDVFILICLIGYLFSLVFVDLVIEYRKIQKAKKLWIFVALINLIWVFFVLPWTPSYEEANILIVIQLIVIIYIVVKIPEGMIISNSQFFRSYDLLIEIVNRDEIDIHRDKLGISSFFDYLEIVMEALENQSTEL